MVFYYTVQLDNLPELAKNARFFSIFKLLEALFYGPQAAFIT